MQEIKEAEGIDGRLTHKERDRVALKRRTARAWRRPAALPSDRRGNNGISKLRLIGLQSAFRRPQTSVGLTAPSTSADSLPRRTRSWHFARHRRDS